MIINAKQMPRRFYGLHMLPGCAEYKEPDKAPYRIFINEETIKKMDGTFEGRPVYVKHVNDVDVKKIQEADGYVVKSFYNSVDGKHWVEFIVVSDAGHEAIQKGWRLSNAYIPKSYAGGGLWNGIEFQKEVTSGEYDHLALVDNPRYDESVIYTPEQFKKYNTDKEIELKKLSNSKEINQMFKIFKKEKVENTLDVANTVIVLPESKIEMTIEQIVNELDAIKNMSGYCNMDHMVKVGEEEMSVGKLVKEHMKMKDSMQNMDEKDGGEKDAEKDEKKADKTKNVKKNADKDGGEKDAEKEEKKSDKTKNDLSPEEKEAEEVEKNKNVAALMNAQAKAVQNAPIIELSADRVKRGKQQYGKKTIASK